MCHKHPVSYVEFYYQVLHKFVLSRRANISAFAIFRRAEIIQKSANVYVPKKEAKLLDKI